MESTRQLKISALLKTELGFIFQRNISEIAGAHLMATITKVTVAKDLSHAKVYVSIFGTEDKTAILKKIKSSLWLIRKLLAEKIRNQVRVIPELSFFLDDTLDYIEHIDELLNK